MSYQLLHGDCVDVLKTLPEGSVQVCITSPPYFNLRNYSTPGQIGMEATPGEFIEKLVAVFREVRRVLRDDGLLWVVIGDTYAGSMKGIGAKGTWYGGAKQRSNVGSVGIMEERPPKAASQGLKNKDLMGIPWMLAFALRDDGWFLRSDCIWHKPNVLPESVEDRPTKAHEYIFLFAKSRYYFYDYKAVIEPNVSALPFGDKRNFKMNDEAAQGKHGKTSLFAGGSKQDFIDRYYVNGRRKRSVWSVPTRSFKGAHFAVFPPALLLPMVLASTSAYGCCSGCGAPWRRVVERGEPYPIVDAPEDQGRLKSGGGAATDTARRKQLNGTRHAEWKDSHPDMAVGWEPSCLCNTDGIEYRANDLELIKTPTGSKVADDPTLEVGRKGFERQRGDNEGARAMTRYEQRQYAAQLKVSPYRDEMAVMAGGATTFAHYVRTDRSGARAVPELLLSVWQQWGWLTPVAMPVLEPLPVKPCLVLDPFVGSGTTGLVSLEHGCDFIGIDNKQEYLDLAYERLTKAGWRSNRPFYEDAVQEANQP